MITIEGPEDVAGKGEELVKVESGPVAKPPAPVSGALTVGILERRLLERFPRSDAEPWDRMGIVVGDPSQPVTGVCVALDPTSQAIKAAAALGANVLLTHHPVFLNAPAAFSPSYDVTTAPGVNVYNAIAQGVALVNFHTALDVSDEARALYLRLLGVDFERMLVPSQANPDRGYGYLCTMRDADAPFTLARLAARCTSVFGRAPRMWGAADTEVKRIVFANGSAGNVVSACLDEHVDCLVCGEIGYHPALDASQAGLAVVELGHDASELPLVALLARAAVEVGADPDRVRILDQAGNWAIPDSTRL